MRCAVLVVGLGLVVTAAPAQEPSGGWAGKLFRDADGKIPAGHDFGTVPKGAMLQHRFPITNIYAVPLQLSTSVSCGCVTATPNPQILQPRETGTLDITMDSTRFNGQKTVTVYVYVRNPQFWSTAMLTINAVCRGDVVLNPGTAVFGVVSRGQSAARDFDLRYQGPQPSWQIIGIAPNPGDPFAVTYGEAFRQPGAVGYRVRLALKPDAPAGALKGEVHLQTNDPNNRLVALPYDVTVQAALTVSPPVTRLGTIAVGGEPVSRRVLVRAGKPFRIVGVDGQGDGLSVELPAAAAPTQSLAIKLQPTRAGPVQRTLTIRTDLDGGASVTAHVEAVVNP